MASTGTGTQRATKSRTSTSARKSPKAKTRLRRPYPSDAETKRRIISMRRQGKTAKQIAMVFGRTEGAIRQKAFALGISLKATGKVTVAKSGTAQRKIKISRKVTPRTRPTTKAPAAA